MYAKYVQNILARVGIHLNVNNCTLKVKFAEVILQTNRKIILFFEPVGV